MSTASFRGATPGPQDEPTAVEQHLGDRLAALVDGELEHDARERVLAHLATCPKCKAEADAQRRLKNVFASDPTPAPSEGLLARLQGLPGGDGKEPSGGGFGGGVFAVGEPSFGYLPGGAHGSVLPGGDRERGFRIHEMDRPGAGSRGRRFAFVAAGAVSLAAIALGGAVPLGGTSDTSARGPGSSGTNVTPSRTTAASGVGTPAAGRRTGAQVLTGGVTALPGTATPPISVSAPLLPGTLPLTVTPLAVPPYTTVSAPFPLIPPTTPSASASATPFPASATPSPSAVSVAPSVPAPSLAAGRQVPPMR